MKYKVGDKDFVLRKNDKITYVNKYGNKNTLFVNGYAGDTIEYFEALNSKVLKVERPIYKTVYKAEKDILDKDEKEYLSAVIRPFRDRVNYIKKWSCSDFRDFIDINLNLNLNVESIGLPYFKRNTMYKGMEADKKYTLEDLGL